MSRGAPAHAHAHAHKPHGPEVLRSRAGLRAVGISFAVLMATALAQLGIFLLTGSVALLADLIHNVGDAATALPLAIAFLMRSRRAEGAAGYVVVGAILVSALVAGATAVDRLVEPRPLEHLGALALAGAVGVAGNEVAAQVRLRAGRSLGSAALVADGHHARVDGLVSLGVVASAGAVALGLAIADPLIGLAITALILRITWTSLRTVRGGAGAFPPPDP